MKTILKVIYGFFVLIIGVIIYMVADQSFASQNYINLVTDASLKAYEENNYDDLARVFSIFSTPIEKEKVALKGVTEKESVTAIYSTVNQFSATYYKDGNSTTDQRIEYEYLVIVSNPKFQYESSSDGTNKTAFRFYGLDKDNNEVYYDYSFVLSENVNSASFVGDPQNEKEAVLHGSRNLLSDYTQYNLLFFPIFETTIKYIMEEKNMVSLTGFNIVENTGKQIYDSNVSCKFDFSQRITSDLATWVNNFNKYNDDKAGIAKLEDEEYKAVVTYLNDFTNNPDTYVANFEDYYLVGYPREAVYTPDIIYKSIGVVLLFLVVAVLLFIVLFYFNRIKEFVARFSKKTPERNIPNKEIRKQTVISKSGVKKEDVVEAKVEEVKPDSKEE